MRAQVPALATVVVSLAGCGGHASSRASPRPDALVREAGGLTLAGSAPPVASPRLLADVRAGRLAGVVVFGPQSAAQLRRFTAQLRAATQTGHQPPPIIAIDQEGGLVKRLAASPPDRAPADMRRASVARRAGRATARALRRLGVTVDLAPVADVPGTHPQVPSRYFGHTPREVAAGVVGFAQGLHAGGIAAAVKHFPGPVGADDLLTDSRPQRLGATVSAIRRDELPYRRLAAAGRGLAPIVMISDAQYPALGATQSGVLSRRLVTGELDATGLSGSVRMTDDLATGALTGIPDVAVHAVGAGIDLVFLSGVGQAEDASAQIASAVHRGTLSRRVVDQAARRVTALRRTMDQPEDRKPG